MPAVIGLNGPPHSGKGWLIENVLSGLIPDAIVMRPSDELFGMMKDEGQIPSHISYQEYKKVPGSRKALIDFATRKRAEDSNVFSRRVTESEKYRNARVVIVDNLGFEDELIWFGCCASQLLVIRIDAPFEAEEPRKSRSRRGKGHWPGDSRQPLTWPTMLTAYDSLQMTLLLRWLTAPDLSDVEAGPYNGIRRVWMRHFAIREPTGDLFAI